MKNRTWFIVLVVALALVAVFRLLAARPDWVEVYYSRGFYAILSTALGRVLAFTPWSVFEFVAAAALLLLLFILFGAFRAWRKGKRTGRQTLLDLLLRISTCCALTCLWFLGAWGMNYYRVPLVEKIGIAGHEARAQDYLHAAQWASSRIRDTYQPADFDHAYASMNRTLESLDQILSRAGEQPVACTPRIKRFLWSLPLDLTGTYGFTSPWTLEVHLSARLFPEEIPFLAAHETAHMKGYASEEEANLLAFEACLESNDRLARFSGFLRIYFYLSRSIPRDAAHALRKTWPDGVNDLCRRIDERNREFEGPVERASRKAYDLYLKMNRVSDGIQSYSRVGNWVAVLHAEEAAAAAEKSAAQDSDT